MDIQKTYQFSVANNQVTGYTDNAGNDYADFATLCAALKTDPAAAGVSQKDLIINDPDKGLLVPGADVAEFVLRTSSSDAGINAGIQKFYKAILSSAFRGYGNGTEDPQTTQDRVRLKMATDGLGQQVQDLTNAIGQKQAAIEQLQVIPDMESPFAATARNQNIVKLQQDIVNLQNELGPLKGQFVQNNQTLNDIGDKPTLLSNFLSGIFPSA